MNYIKRAFLNIVRQPGKSILLFSTIFALAILLSSAISIRNAIVQTESNLRSRLPAVATLGWEHAGSGYLDGDSPTFEYPTSEMISEVGALPYIGSYDFSGSSGLVSRDLVRADNMPLFESLLEDLMTTEPNLIDNLQLNTLFLGLKSEGGQVELLFVQGISSEQPSDLELGIISLNSGRLMTESEIAEAAPVAVVSYDFAQVNSLEIGSTFVLENNVYDEVRMYESGIFDNFMYWHLEEFLMAQEVVELEVVGIVEINPSAFHVDMDNVDMVTWRISEINNTIFMPVTLLESVQRSVLPYWIELREMRAEHFYGGVMTQTNLSDELPLELTATFILNDPSELGEFKEAAARILPDGWGIYDFSNAFAPMTSSMENMRTVANLIFVGGVLATIVVLSLLINLFLRDRRGEVGLYRALGESKFKIGGQIVSEVLIISILAIILGFFAGNMVSSQLSRNMIEQEITLDADNVALSSAEMIESQTFGIRHLAPGPMEIDEMMASFDTSLNITSSIFYFSIQVGTIFVAAVIPVALMLKSEPKELLMQLG